MITVSVCMITYNHENYIREAINGVLMQSTNFNLELVIANDCSTDKTDDIINDIIKVNPKGHLINYINNKKNIGIMPNLLQAIDKCKGNYIAMCEGDDYWITKDKLQKQVEIFNTVPNLGLVYTGVKFFNQNNEEFIQIPSRFAKRKEDVIPMMLESKFIEFATTLFKRETLNKVISTIKVELNNAVIGDTRILLEIAYQKEIYFLDQVTTVYRVAEGSASYPKSIEKYIFALLDTYWCRKSFVLRNNLDANLLGYSICNTNKNLINKAFVSTRYSIAIKLLSNLLIKDTFKFCDFKTFKKKISLGLIVKLFFTFFGVGILKQKLNNES